MSVDPTVVHLLDARLAEAELELQQRSGGAAVCSFTRPGGAVSGVKDAEGRWAALRQVQRSLRTGMPPGAAVGAVQDEWAQDLARRSDQAAGPDWIGYRTGGLDALERLADSLTRGEM